MFWWFRHIHIIVWSAAQKSSVIHSGFRCKLHGRIYMAGHGTAAARRSDRDSVRRRGDSLRVMAMHVIRPRSIYKDLIGNHACKANNVVLPRRLCPDEFGNGLLFCTAVDDDPLD